MKSKDIAAYVAGLEEALRTQPDCFAMDHEGRIADLAAEVERLRAALPVLPDVGLVEWYDTDREVLKIGRAHLWDADNLDEHEQHALKELASIYAARAFLDAEAADTSSDDEVSEEDAVREFLMGTSVYGGLTDERGVAGYARQIVEVLDAHRAARTSGEAGQ